MIFSLDLNTFNFIKWKTTFGTIYRAKFVRLQQLDDIRYVS